MRLTNSIALVLFVTACAQPPVKSAPDGIALQPNAQDQHTFANFDALRVSHLSLAGRVDFDQRVFEGRATLKLERLDATETKLVLDTEKLEVLDVRAGNKSVPHSFGAHHPVLGRPLQIDIGDANEVTVHYRTHPEAEALQWLTAEQAGSTMPYLFTQGQSILTRSWIPMQDTPAIRITYDAEIQVPSGMMAVMSAENPTELNPDGKYRFTMKEPIPPYLLALGVGDIAFRAIDSRSGVYASPKLVEAAAKEFQSLPAMMTVAEELYGPYRWGRYDILVLPPSFPYGGMENPRLTFLSPTVIAGDESLVGVVAHELAHSWSGNLVTNATWDDFWLNEGFTTYLEARIMEKVKGLAQREMHDVLEIRGLERTVKLLTEDNKYPFTSLKIALGERHPDDAFSGVPYMKGSMFLQKLEAAFGRDRFDGFLRNYFDRHAFKTMTTEVFLGELKGQATKDDVHLDEKWIDAWVYEPGLPQDPPATASVLLEQVQAQAEKWKKGKPAGSLETKGWTSPQWVYFIDQFDGYAMSEVRMMELDAVFGFSQSTNAEIAARWFRRSIENDYQLSFEYLKPFLIHVGRRKFIEPLYRSLLKHGHEDFARRTYANARPYYHSAAQQRLDVIVGQ